jgi:hypothetical protein
MNGEEGKLFRFSVGFGYRDKVFFSNKVYYTFTFSEDKSKLLLYKTYTRNNGIHRQPKYTTICCSIAVKRILTYNDNQKILVIC